MRSDAGFIRIGIRGPGRNNWNTSIFKNFKLKERLSVQFRAEAYNTFNHTQFNAVDTTIQFNAAPGLPLGGDSSDR